VRVEIAKDGRIVIVTGGADLEAAAKQAAQDTPEEIIDKL
jgi:hypothetical protein